MALMTCGIGCRTIQNLEATKNQTAFEPVANPLIVPLMDRWFIMDEISDEIDDYFRIFREERIRDMKRSTRRCKPFVVTPKCA